MDCLYRPPPSPLHTQLARCPDQRDGTGRRQLGNGFVFAPLGSGGRRGKARQSCSCTRRQDVYCTPPPTLSIDSASPPAEIEPPYMSLATKETIDPVSLVSTSSSQPTADPPPLDSVDALENVRQQLELLSVRLADQPRDQRDDRPCLI